ncbi:Crp/Fnr family transcriptional regulator [Pseudofulvibacter geojedonensis]|uniref:Crp/Fnr family transcriptional regulator n=1 Tax=Pseudofulvibacter geojedonensis TaxID=1123758 RepID=A0ABW3I2U1_9FLAO
MDYLYEYAQNYSGLTKESFDLAKKHLSEVSFKANDILCDLQTEPRYGYFIKSGIIRAYTVNEKGKEFTKSLFSAFQFAGPLSALIEGRKSELIYETLTDCEVIQGDYIELRKLFDENIDLMRFSHKMLQFYFIGLENKVIDLGALTATERYLNLKERFSNIENLIPQYQIASILGITPIQLSRIRKEIYSK